MASTNPLAVQGTFTFPPDEGQAAVAVLFAGQVTYQSVLDTRLVMSGSGSQSVPFGSTAGSVGVKAALVEYENQPGAAPVQLRVNAGSDNLELSPGGIWAYLNPSPAAGLTALTIVRTGDCVVQVRLFG